jgi:UDP-glucose 4-epimerase
MRTLVTGGAGFVGSHLVDALLERGHQVLVIDDLSSGRRALLNDAAIFHQLDICDARTAVVIDEFRPELLFHLAAQMDVRKSVADPAFDARVNVMGMAQVLDACARVGLRKVVFTSTGGAIYGEQDRFPAPEDHAIHPASPYGVSKRCGELYLEYFARAANLPSVSLRCANIYGPRQNPHGEAGVVAIFAKKMVAGEAPLINGDGKQTRDFVAVSDVVRAALLSAEKDFTGPVNIGTGVETEINALADELARAAGYTGEMRRGPAMRGEQRRSVVDPSLAARALGWSPSVSLDKGLAATVEWFRAQVRPAS